MHSNSREGIQEDFDALRAAVSRIVGHSYDALTCPERLALLERLEQETRRLRVPRHQLINQLAEQTDSTELGGKLPHVLADRLRITRAEAGRRVAEAADLGPRRAVTGEPLPPLLTGTAAGERAGEIGAGHVQVIRRFLNQLPAWVDAGTRESAEQHLAELAAQFRPDEVTDVADGLADCINPDGTYSDEDRARRRRLTLGKQGLDGMSELRALLTPEARAGIEAVLAKTAAPGMCNPEDDAPVVDGSPDDETIQRDTRSAAQRSHDGLNAALRALLASGQLGQHNGLPATIVVTTTLENLEAAAGTGLTGGGTRLPMSDVIRIARHAHHYLALFDKGKAVGLYHTKRLASPGQRIVLYAKDRGCTRPGCNVPGYWCEVHHVEDWASTRHTDVNTLTLACGSDHRLVGPGGWTTRKDTRGDTQWIPPPHLDRGQPRVNTFHHPEKIFADEDDEDQGAA
ncbi:HNH endonuclease signature motif containing protein [Mycobacterium sp.]|uniref:HNH endonuclease signature motif containing protein n=5 Tax=Mycobacterium sp. TaxID=1785 RepID=UPI003F9600D6